MRFLTFKLHSQSAAGLVPRHAHHHKHMFKQQVPYAPLPLALGEPRDHILLSHTHHHPHGSQPDIWRLMAAWVVFQNDLSEIQWYFIRQQTQLSLFSRWF